MRFNCGLTEEEKAEKHYQDLFDKLHFNPLFPGEYSKSVFSVLPRKVGSQDCRWLERVLRVQQHGFRYFSQLGDRHVFVDFEGTTPVERLILLRSVLTDWEFLSVRIVKETIRYEAIER